MAISGLTTNWLESSLERLIWQDGWGVTRNFLAWDGSYYLRLSELGYSKDDSACAFYPLWPLLMRWCAPLFGGSHLLAGWVLANALSLAGWLLFYRLTAARFGTAAARWALALLVAWPGSLFYQLLYSESLFFFLLMGLWWGLERRSLPVALGAAALLPLTRAIGVFAVLPIGWLVATRFWADRGWRAAQPLPQLEFGSKATSPAGEALAPCVCHKESEEDGEHKSEGTTTIPRAPSSIRPPFYASWWLLLLAPLAGWGVYLGLMGHWTGNPWEGFEAQKHWGRHSIWHLVDVPKFVYGLSQVVVLHEWPGGLVDRVAFILLLCMLPTLWRLGKDLLAWTWMLAVIPAMSGTFTSYLRYHSCVFPFFIALAVWLLARRAAWPRWAVLAVFVAGHAVMVWRFLNSYWVG